MVVYLFVAVVAKADEVALYVALIVLVELTQGELRMFLKVVNVVNVCCSLVLTMLFTLLALVFVSSKDFLA